MGSTELMSSVPEPQLEREGRRLGGAGGKLLLLGLLIAIPGIVLVVIGSSALGFGLAVLGIAAIPGIIGAGMLLSSGVARWSARHKSFA
ncbi:MAG: hypothetical protein JOZ73_14060 [Solirubrobacterales bacterium]|nr:hypothetical protein [Solirubrobacterales bacterium]